MKNLGSRKLKRIRNILIFSGILVGFLIWISLPEVMKNTSLHLTKSTNYGSKLLLLPVIFLPLFAFLGGKMRQDIYVDDEAERAKAIEENEVLVAGDQIVYAIVEDVLVIAIMIISFFL